MTDGADEPPKSPRRRGAPLCRGGPRRSRGIRRDELHSGPASVGAGDLPSRHHHGDPRHRRIDGRAIRHRTEGPRLSRPDPGGVAERDHRDRGQELLPARRRRSSAHRLRPARQRATEELRAGRLDADAAARPRHLPVPPQDHLPEDQRSLRRLRDRAALFEGTDPDDVRERDLLRARELRRRSGRAVLLRQGDQGPDARGGGPAGGHRPAARGPVAVPQPGRGAPPPGDCALTDGRGEIHH